MKELECFPLMEPPSKKKIIEQDLRALTASRRMTVSGASSKKSRSGSMPREVHYLDDDGTVKS